MLKTCDLIQHRSAEKTEPMKTLIKNRVFVNLRLHSDNNFALYYMIIMAAEQTPPPAKSLYGCRHNQHITKKTDAEKKKG